MENLYSANPIKTALSIIEQYILTEHEKEKKITHTVTTETQHHPILPVSPFDTSTGNLQQQHALKSHNHSIKKQQQTNKKELTAL